ncbi:MAG: PAS domain S-box protein [Pyrinomonadaceae bacterium]|nr:PAS domain S-box protein [Pyrinomonadaceae bacterium]
MIQSPSEKCRVLIVDDDQKVCAFLVELLQQEGYEVASASDGGSALEIVNSFEPDLVISDVVMPVLNGIELCRQIKKDPQTSSIPVLLMSGHRNESEDSMEGLTAGADDYLGIPFRHEELLVKVARLAERSRVEKHYRELVEQAADIIYTRDLDGYMTSINSAGARFFGKSVDEILGSHLSSLIGADAAARDIEATKKAATDSPLRSIYYIQDTNGAGRYLDGVITIERDRQNRATGIRGVARDITEQKLAEEALRESEQRYRQLVEVSPEAIVVQSEGRLVYVNPAAMKLWGASSVQELVGKPVIDLVHPDYRELVKNRIRGIEEQGIPASLSLQRHIRLDGEIIDVEVTGMPFSFRGEPAVQAVIRDVTERIRAREVLKQTEARLRTVVGSASLVLFALDQDGVFTLLEGEGLATLGLKPDEVIGRPVSEVYHDNPVIVENISRALAGETFSRAVDIGDLTFQTRYTPLIDEEDSIVGVIGVAVDITDGRKAQQALQNNEQRYRELFENANDIIYTHDLAGNITSLNRSGETLTGYSREEAARMNIADVLAPEYLPVARQMMARKADEQTPTVYELEIVTKTDRRVRLEVSTRLILQDGRAVGVQGVGRDLTERKHSEEALAYQSQREAMTHRISQAIRCSLDSSEVFTTAVRELGSYLNADRCSLFVKDEKGNRARNVAEYHAEGILPAATDFALADLRALIDSLDANGVLCFDDAAHDVRIAEVYQRILAKADVQSIMYVAIRVGDEVTAAFALSTTQELRHWSDSDIALAKGVADQTGIAIRQAELYQKAEATSKREVLVNSVTTAIRASLSLPEVLSTATRQLGLALEASRVHVHLYDAENPISKVAHDYVASGCTSIESLHVSYEDPIGRHLLRMAKPLVIDDSLNFAEEPADFSAAVREFADKVNLRSQIDYPLIVKGLFRGVLCIHQTDRQRSWTEGELALVHSVAECLAIGMAQAELFQMVAKGKSEWETTFDSMSDGIFIFDRAGLLKRVNTAGAAMEASNPRALLGKKCCDVLLTSSQASTCVVEKAIEEGRSVTIEVIPDQLNRPILVSIEPVMDKGGAVTAAVCTARDLSELRNVQAVAREHQSLLTNILESARESIYAVDMDGCFKWCNNATLMALGLKREEFIGRYLPDFVHESDRETVAGKLGLALLGEAQTYEMRFLADNGSLRYARVDNSPLVVEGRITGVLGIARDITEQKEERERAARADKLRALGQLASGVAHDFNNSLAAILGRSQLIRRQTQDEAVVRNLEIIQTAAEDAAATVRRIQTFARKSPAKEFDILDVAGLLNDAVEITRTRWQNEARLRGLDYDVALEAEGGLQTMGSASELREVFVNLIVNAVDAMPKGGRLQISCARAGARLRLQFSDNGTGMPEDVRQKIFDPFFSTKGTQGTGLGLSVSHSIIERHEGSIRVASEVGGGTVFTIDLPAAEAAPEIVAVPVDDVEVPSLSILVVDDEPAVRETLAEMLEMMGHRVMLADGGQNALQALATNECDLVFTDLAMPEMDGWETSREIRKRWPAMSVVLVTGYGTGTRPPSGEDGLVNGVIGKPFDFNQISQTITSVIANEPALENAAA